jgi:uncharacterized membrane protein YfcA
VSTSVLLSFGVPLTTASASVHAAEVFTTGASALSHWRLGNVDRRLFLRLAPAGMVGGGLGAYVLTAVPGEIMRPVVSIYLALMGGIILWRATRGFAARDTEPKHVAALGLCGGFVDAVGGGGWGPLVASTLVGRGTTARLAIGSTNAAEFLLTVTISATFVVTVGLELWPVIAGLVLGGVIAAPLAAYATRQIPDRPLMILVGVVIVLLSVREMARLFGDV